MEHYCETQERQTPCVRDSQAFLSTGLCTVQDGFATDSPGGVSASAVIPRSSSLGSGWVDRGTHKLPTLLWMAREVLLIYLLVSVSGWLVSFLSGCQPVSLSLKHCPGKTTLSTPAEFLSSLPYMKHVYCVFRIPSLEEQHRKLLMRSNPVLNQHLWNYCFCVLLKFQQSAPTTGHIMPILHSVPPEMALFLPATYSADELKTFLNRTPKNLTVYCMAVLFATLHLSLIHCFRLLINITAHLSFIGFGSRTNVLIHFEKCPTLQIFPLTFKDLQFSVQSRWL